MPQGVGVRLPPPAPRKEILMKIIEEKKLKGLKKEFIIEVPYDDFEKSKNEKLKDISTKVKIAGFRPGKVPLSHVEKLYGKETNVEVIEKIISDSSKKVLDEKDLRPAINPDIKLIDEMDKIVGEKNNIKYSMAFEALPEVKLVDFSKIKLENPVAKPNKKDIDEALDYLAKQNKDYKTQKKSEKAKEGDKLVLNYSGSIEGEKFEGGSAKNAEIIIGSNTFIDNFEDQLIGQTVGSTKTLKVKFPDNYPNKDLENKDAEFDVEVLEILNPVDSEINDELAKKFGQEKLKDLKNALEEQIKKDFDQASRMKLKDSLFLELEKKHKFELPESLVNQEYEQMWNQLEHQLKDQKKTLSDLDIEEKEIKKNYKEISQKRISIGLIVAEIGRQNKIELEDNDYNLALQNEVQKYPGQEQQVLEFYKKNPDSLRNLTAPIYEEKVVDFVLKKAELKDKKVTRNDLFSAENNDGKPKKAKKEPKKSVPKKKKSN